MWKLELNIASLPAKIYTPMFMWSKKIVSELKIKCLLNDSGKNLMPELLT